MKHRHSSQSGFTLIETLIAILILALTIGALLTLTAGGFFSIRYAKNDIVASNLLQESLEYIRNTRDMASQEEQGWNQWRDTYLAAECQSNNGCQINLYTLNDSEKVKPCGAQCENLLYFPASGFYGYGAFGSNVFDQITADPQQAQPYETSFVRTIKMEPVTIDGVEQLIVTARMDWLNGTNRKSATQSIILTPWNLQ